LKLIQNTSKGKKGGTDDLQRLGRIIQELNMMLYIFVLLTILLNHLNVESRACFLPLCDFSGRHQPEKRSLNPLQYANSLPILQSGHKVANYSDKREKGILVLELGDTSQTFEEKAVVLHSLKCFFWPMGRTPT
jgi:hypothetical protein